MKTRLGVFFGGVSAESDVSVLTAMQVFGAVDLSKYEVVPVFMDGAWWTGQDLTDLRAFRPFEPKAHTEVVLRGRSLYKVRGKRAKHLVDLDCALICCHGGEGENGSLQGLFETQGLPYTSTPVEGSALCMNKARFKAVLTALKYRHAKHVAVSREEFFSDRVSVLSKIVKRQGFPVIVKPASLGSSIGVTSAKNREELEEALALCFALSGEVVVEREVSDKCELNCACVRYDDDLFVSAVERPKKEDGVLTFEDKYVAGNKEGSLREIPADIPLELAKEVRATTLKLYRDFNLSGVVRVDYIWDRSKNELLVNEINTVPGSLAYYLFEPCGISFATLIDMLVDEAKVRMKRTSYDYSEFRRGAILNGSVCK